MTRTEGQSKARLAVQAAMASRGMNPGDLARRASVDAGTVGDFLSGQRWPKLRTQGRIEDALGWDAGTIAAIVNGAEPPSPKTEPTVYRQRVDGEMEILFAHYGELTPMARMRLAQRIQEEAMRDLEGGDGR